MPDACHNKADPAAGQRSPADRSRHDGALGCFPLLAIVAAVLAGLAAFVLPGVAAAAKVLQDATATIVGLDHPTAIVVVSETPYPLTVASVTPGALTEEHLVLVGEAVQVTVDWGTATPEPTFPGGQVALRLYYSEPLPALAPDESRLAIYCGTTVDGPWARFECSAPSCAHDTAANSLLMDITQTGYYLVAAPQVSAVVVTPDPATPHRGDTVQFAAQVVDYANETVSGAHVTWKALAAAGSIDQYGLFTATGSVGVYNDAVTATVGSVSGTATVSIEPWRLFLPVDANAWSARVVPNDPFYSAWQANLEQIGAPLAWSLTKGSSSVVVAIIDSGIDLDHPDLAANIIPGWDFVNGDAVADDDYGHGTHVAGIVGAIGNNAVGVAGIGWNTRLMPVKVLSSTGVGDSSVAATAIRWAADSGADILNMSVGTTGYSVAMAEAVQYAIDRGCLVVAASGNVSATIRRGSAVYPAAYPGVIGVGAVDSAGAIASFSNSGSFLDLVAPGVSILSTYSFGRYMWMTGTSMATPHIAGLAALVWASNPALTAGQVRSALTSTATDLGLSGWDESYGYGLANGFSAIAAASPSSVSSLGQPDDAVLAPSQPTTLEPGTYNPGVLWVLLKPGLSAEAVLGADGALAAMAEDPDVEGLVRVAVEPGTELQTLLRLLSVPGVEAVYPDYIVFAM